eukprot:TRINITY_DN1626_c0_g1_i1.p2 TRINITY_DN1626_c0_g1~~TRINITY_DN1626_c0_g1_i1.p2  ORF type:complete len:125 (+),score=19.07 TRINITY_DN1626_c0_g1_i1:148-522(+)
MSSWPGSTSCCSAPPSAQKHPSTRACTFCSSDSGVGTCLLTSGPLQSSKRSEAKAVRSWFLDTLWQALKARQEGENSGKRCGALAYSLNVRNVGGFEERRRSINDFLQQHVRVSKLVSARHQEN